MLAVLLYGNGTLTVNPLEAFIRELWIRNERYYPGITVEHCHGRKEVRRAPLQVVCGKPLARKSVK